MDEAVTFADEPIVSEPFSLRQPCASKYFSFCQAFQLAVFPVSGVRLEVRQQKFSPIMTVENGHAFLRTTMLHFNRCERDGSSIRKSNIQ